MPDFAGIVRDRLQLHGMDAARSTDIHAELTAHLEDVYAAAIARGYDDEAAVRMALEHVNDWTQLAHGVMCAADEGAMMSHHLKTLWMPGMTMVGFAGAMLIAVCWFAPGSWWANPDASVQRTASMLGVLLYVLFGAVGAAWSRRAGGTWKERFGAGLLPLALHVAILLPAIAAGMLAEVVHHPVFGLNPQLRLVFAMIIVPGLALLTGAAPFLRQTARAR